MRRIQFVAAATTAAALVALTGGTAHATTVPATAGQVRSMLAAIQAQLDGVGAGDPAVVARLSCGFFSDDLRYHPKALAVISARTRLVDGRIRVGHPRAATVANNLGRVTVDTETAKRNPKAATSVRFTLDRTSGAWKVCAASRPYVDFAGLDASA